ncbi:molecular chaperone [Microbacterium testaceum]|uniref:Molecular chaperone n=1 Tax=Microbacterium testaceum TaxID=2033 RepID=A0A147ESL7_MICTE|nr:Hsp70 family protein [Microbacterium testaceum]KTR87522.1 molecular chaperone [Microbacterium testaceum]
MATSIGIDLGTTYSCVIHYSSEGVETVVASASGGELTPSVVHISESGEATVGDDAKRLLTRDPDNVIVGIKRKMGTDHPLEYAGRTLTPEAVSALILTRLAEDAAVALRVPRDELRAVITVPAYFGVAEKEATAAAARIAGVDCPELLPEPVAAAYAYGWGTDAATTSLVYDLGGGTFDAAVVGLEGGRYRVWAVDGESHLGGLDWDGRIQDLLWEEVAALEGGDELRYEEDVIAAVETASEKVKRQLTGAFTVTERIRFRGRTISITLTRERFEEVTRDLLLRSLTASERAMDAARRAGAPAVSRILLVGGSTRMPMVRDALSRHFGVDVELTDPDRAVARGAAILSEQLLASQDRRAITVHGIRRMAAGMARVTSVLPRSVGVLVCTSREPYSETPHVVHIVHANAPLPIVRQEHAVATIVPNQRRARIQLYEQGGNEASPRVEDNRMLIEGEITDIPPGPAGTKVALRISVSIDGRITLEAMTGDGTRPLVVEAFMHGVLDESELRAQRAVAGSLRVMG